MSKKKKIRVFLVVSLLIILIGAGVTTFFINKSNKEKERVANMMYEQEMEEVYDNIVVEFGRIKDYLDMFDEFLQGISLSSDNLRFSIFVKTFKGQINTKDFEDRRMYVEGRVNKIKSPTKEMQKVDIAFKEFFETYKDIQMNFTDFNNYDYKVYKAKMDNLESDYHQANLELLELRKIVIERRIHGK